MTLRCRGRIRLNKNHARTPDRRPSMACISGSLSARFQRRHRLQFPDSSRGVILMALPHTTAMVNLVSLELLKRLSPNSQSSMSEPTSLQKQTGDFYYLLSELFPSEQFAMLRQKSTGSIAFRFLMSRSPERETFWWLQNVDSVCPVRRCGDLLASATYKEERSSGWSGRSQECCDQGD